MSEAVRLILTYVLIPLWLLAGVGDWACHRRDRIETTAGLRESALHLLMLVEVGIPILLALFLEINALVLWIMLAALAIHAITAWWDVHYTYGRRRIGPTEQHMHGLLEVLPAAAFALVAVTHPAQFLAMFGIGGADGMAGPGEYGDYTVRWKETGMSTAGRALVLLVMFVFGVLPFVEEFARCWRWRRHGGNRQAEAQQARNPSAAAMPARNVQRSP